jgi:hypothetical protein
MKSQKTKKNHLYRFPFDSAPSLIFQPMAFQPPVFGLYFNVFFIDYALRKSNSAFQPLHWFACLVGSNLHSVDDDVSIQLFALELNKFGTPFFGRYSQYPSWIRLCANQIWCSSPSIDLLAFPSAILPAIITTLRFGAHSVRAINFGRFPSVVRGIKILRFSIRIDLRASSASICRAKILCGSNSRHALRDLIPLSLLHFTRSEIRAVRRCFELSSAVLNLYEQVSALQPPALAFLCAGIVRNYSSWVICPLLCP